MKFTMYIPDEDHDLFKACLAALGRKEGKSASKTIRDYVIVNGKSMIKEEQEGSNPEQPILPFPSTVR